MERQAQAGSGGGVLLAPRRERLSLRRALPAALAVALLGASVRARAQPAPEVAPPSSDGAQGEAPPGPPPAPLPPTAARSATLGPTPGARIDAPTPAPPRSARRSWVDPWSGSQLFVQLGAHPNVFAPGLQQTRNGTAELVAFLSPRFSLGKDWQLRATLPLSYELTDTSATATTRSNELRLGNTLLGLWYRSIPEVWGVHVMVAPTLTLPTSLEARSQTLIVSPGLLVQAARGFERVLGGDLLVIASAGYQRPLYEFTTPGTVNTPVYPPQCYGGDPSCVEQVSGVANPRDLLTWTLTVTPSWGRVSPGVLFRMTHVWPYTFSELPGVESLEGRATVRNQSFFAVWVDYSWNAWLTTEVGYQLTRLSLDADGTYGNPFFAQYQEGMRVYLGTNVSFDALVRSLRGEDGEGGVVRARRGGPAVTF